MTDSPFIASIETTEKGTFTYGFHLGTIESVARDCAKDLIRLRHSAKLGDIVVRTVGLMRGGKLIDTYDGEDWMSDILDRACAADVDTRQHHPDCPACDGFGCRCDELT